MLDQIGNHKEILLLDDFNARTERKDNYKVVGPYKKVFVNNNGEFYQN